jgi:hypothetical protein
LVKDRSDRTGCPFQAFLVSSAVLAAEIAAAIFQTTAAIITLEGRIEKRCVWGLDRSGFITTSFRWYFQQQRARAPDARGDVLNCPPSTVCITCCFVGHSPRMHPD